MKIEEEFLIHDFVGMLGSIGGTLGLFIGFSFLGGVSFVLIQTQSLLNHFVTETLETNKKSEVIDVKPFINPDTLEDQGELDINKVKDNKTKAFDLDALAKSDLSRIRDEKDAKIKKSQIIETE